MADSQPTIDHMTSVLKTRLMSPRGTIKPHGFDKAFTNCSKKVDSTERIFLDAGPQAWVAYFLATHGHGRHYDGQRKDLDTIEAFDQLASKERERVAASAAYMPVHNTVALLIQRLSIPRGQLCHNNRRLSSSLSRQSSTSPPTRTQDTTSLDYEISANPAPALNEVPRGLWDSPEPHQTISKPFLASTVILFNEYMCGAIRRIGDRAGITMAFSYDLSSQIACLMSLDILANKVEYIATTLFGVHLETEDGFRYLVLGNGVRCIPQEEMSLQGAEAEGINTLLGPCISDAIRASPRRKKEMEEAISATRCVTMQIARNPTDGAVLNLNMALEEGYKAKDKLSWW